MRTGGGKPKGTRFERDCCRDLSRWISRGKRDDLFWRSAMSGGRATVGLRSGERRANQAGDISLIDARGELLLRNVVIECKTYKDLQIASSIIKETGLLFKFWSEIRDVANKFGKHPMLLAKQNMQPVMCFMSTPCVKFFEIHSDFVICTLPRWGCSVVLLEDFLKVAQIPKADATLSRERHRIRL